MFSWQKNNDKEVTKNKENMYVVTNKDMKQLFNFANHMQGLGQVLKTKSGSRRVWVGKKCSNIRWRIPGYLIYHQVYPGISGI